ncbi:GNAT family N-acetyltransferase [Chitinophaga sp. Mgbs1]|uniref:GNAT family N-acetyltransferase n=1 Tax=Chitinophaga solisilvae TaxID=1233460 RepID=A0A433WEV1_9BACT|nr:GNAT family N-acetyltransferase [Chitinophaga solisilvae]
MTDYTTWLSSSTGFSSTATDYWKAIFSNSTLLYGDATCCITTKPDLPEGLMTLETAAGQFMAVLTPEMAVKAALQQQPVLPEQHFRQQLARAGIPLHGADYVFYYTEAARQELLQEQSLRQLRRLTAADQAIFDLMQAAATEEDKDGAYVELNHWAVFGSFAGEQLAGAASMYPWDDSQLADLGVLTLEPFRGQGHARRLVRAICRYALEQGYEPQYRCQLDNEASVRLAHAAGLTLFGKWDFIASHYQEQITG